MFSLFFFFSTAALLLYITAMQVLPLWFTISPVKWEIYTVVPRLLQYSTDNYQNQKKKESTNNINYNIIIIF